MVVSRRHETRVGLFRLTTTNDGYSYRPAGFVDLPDTFGGWTPCAEPGEGPQVEGMVVDRTDNVLYAAQEDVGVWRIPLSRNGFGRPSLVDRVRGFGQPATYDEATEECVPTGPPSPEAGTSSPRPRETPRSGVRRVEKSCERRHGATLRLPRTRASHSGRGLGSGLETQLRLEQPRAPA